MTDSTKIMLCAGDWSARVDAGHGCVIRTLKLSGSDILRPMPEGASDPLLSACYPCVPWFGRLYEDLAWNGRGWPIAPTHPRADDRYALHGFGWISPWTIIERGEASARCKLDFRAGQMEFPFAFYVEQLFHLDVDGLSITLSLTNPGPVDIPAGLALHPFFNRDDKTKLRLRADQVFVPPTLQNPGGETVPMRAAFDFSIPRPLPGELLDHSFIGAKNGAEIFSDGRVINVTSTSELTHVYTPPGGDFVCVEPITHLPGQLGHTLLGAGQTMSLTMRVSLAKT